MKYRNTKALCGVTAVLTAIFLLFGCVTNAAWRNAGAINRALNVQTSRVETLESEGEAVPADYYKSDYGDTSQGNGNNPNTLLTADDLARLEADEKAFCIQEQIDGSVLLMNNNSALPLSKGDSITLLGNAVEEPYYKAASGGGKIDQTKKITFYDALKAEGFNINDTVFSAYTASTTPGRQYGYNVTKYGLGEEPASFYTSALTGSFSSYGDAAVIMFAREGGEYRDLAVYESADDNGEEGISHLALHKNELDLLELAKRHKESGDFKKIIVLLNTTNPMEVGALADYGVDACLWIGGCGTYGFAGVADILSGDGNPSGKLVDTYATNSRSAPAVVNFGIFDYTNADEVTAACTDAVDFVTHYTVQQEGIYVGYKYYETRYADCIAGIPGANGSKGVWASSNNSWNYAEEVTYPFGYGLSYTTFDQELVSLDWTGKTVTAQVKVTNTGSVAGKSVVEIYVQAPYEHGVTTVEKSAVQLAGFGKTGLLEKGASQTLTIEMSASLFASYDSNSNGGEGGYVMEKGDYYFAIGSDVHDALNNILAAQGKTGLYDHTGAAVTGDTAKVQTVHQAEDDETTYSVSPTGAKIQNLFDDMDVNHFLPEEEHVKYLSRSDWEGTYPVEAPAIRATDEMIALLDGNTYVKPDDAPAAGSFTQGVSSGLALVNMHDVDYDDDETWTKFLNQLTTDEMGSVLYEYCGVNRVIDSIGFPGGLWNDGPDGLDGGYLGAKVGANYENVATCYPNQSLAAATWDTNTLAQLGSFLAEDGIFTGLSANWGAGNDLHRTPFSGRNFEYFSEDSVLAYELSGSLISAQQEKGLVSCVKHFVGNDQESMRTGLATFSTEQAFRENSLRAFEGSFVKGGALGTMTAFNRIGCTAVPHSEALLVDLLCGEWGFKGLNITDACGSRSFIHSVESIVSGTDMFCMAYENRADEVLSVIGRGDGYILQKLREANQDIFYALSRSNLINGMSSNNVIIPITPWWQTALIAIDAVLGILALASAAVWISAVVRSKKREGEG